MILNGRAIAKDIYSQIQKEVETLKTPPTLGVILAGNNPASLSYIKQKKKWAEKIGIGFKLFPFQSDISEQALLEETEKLNTDSSISGYIIQLPLPKHINTDKVINAINPEKDVDGFHPINQGKILIWDHSGFAPCTPAGIMTLFKSQNIEVMWKKVVILGRSNIVGKPIALLLINAGATVTSCNSKTPDISHYTKTADIVICATGVPGLLKKTDITNEAVIIDVWFWVVDGEIVGDAEYESIEQNGNLITPVPGGVGPMTVALLMQNTLTAHKRQSWIK